MAVTCPLSQRAASIDRVMPTADAWTQLAKVQSRGVSRLYRLLDARGYAAFPSLSGIFPMPIVST
jgi:hypothetical protein